MNRRTFIKALGLLPFISTTEIAAMLSKVEEKGYRHWEISFDNVGGQNVIQGINLSAKEVYSFGVGSIKRCVCKASVDGKQWDTIKNFDLKVEGNVYYFGSGTV